MPSERPDRPIPKTRFNPDSDDTANDNGDRFSRSSHERLRASYTQLATDVSISQLRAQELDERRKILAKRIHDIQQESGALYAIMRTCEEQVLRARFSADKNDRDSLKMVEDDIRRFARSPDAPLSLREALSHPVIDDRRRALVDALRNALRSPTLSDTLRSRLEGLWQRMERAHRSVSMAEAALVHAKREFLPYQRRIAEIQKVLDRLEEDQRSTRGQLAASKEKLEQKRRLESLPSPSAEDIAALEEALRIRLVRGEQATWQRLDSVQQDILRRYLAQFTQDQETILNILSANLRTDYEREELRIALTRLASSIENPSHVSSQAPRHLNRRRPAPNGS
jgi:hypothetical protein